MPHSTDSRAALLRQLPAVDELLRRPRLAALAGRAGRDLLVEAARGVLEAARAALRQAPPPAAPPAAEELERQVAAAVERELEFSLRPVINATGVVLHTNLGRAPLPAAAAERIAAAATQYSNLEYDLATGARGRRDVHTARLLARVAGAEAALVVNNNAAAVWLVLNTLARGGEVIVSRGELVEIGDGFRIPDIMAESGAVLREVGTTNRTRLADYERAIGERTRLLLRVHRSNFRIVGFTAQASLEELVGLGRRKGLPVFEDLGSGCLGELPAGSPAEHPAEHGPQAIQEPVVRASLAAGADVVSFSGDKLLGGPQAGIIAGQRDLVERIRRNPLYRALRVDKLTIAALEAVLHACARGAAEEIPVLRMIGLSPGEIGRRAAALAEALRAAAPPGETEVGVREGVSVVGGGSTPGQALPTRLVSLASARWTAAQLEARLRLPAAGPPVIARVEENRLVLDLRTVFPEQDAALLAAVAAALR